MTPNGIYIYGIVPSHYPAEMFQLLEDSGVYHIPFQDITAIVSDRNSTYLNYSDRESLGYLLVHHQKTIEGLMGKGFRNIIPVRLGSIVESRERVIEILASGYNLIIEALSKIENLTEIDIAVTWADFPAIIQEIASHPDIIAIKEEILRNADLLVKVDPVKVGMLVQSKLKEKNLKVEQDILNSLLTSTVDIKTHEVMNDEMVTNSAFLLKRSQKEAFEQIIEKLDEKYSGSLKFKLVGPLPCYSFFTVEFKELNPQQIEWAGKVLGLSDMTSETEMKRAYIEKVKLFHPDAHHETGDAENFNRINVAYSMMLDYSAALKQQSKEEVFSFAKEKMNENFILVKLKE